MTSHAKSLSKEFREFMESDCFAQAKPNDKDFLVSLIRIQSQTGQRKLTPRQKNNITRILRETGWYAGAD